VQAFAIALAAEAAALTPASQARALAAVKALLAFGHRLGYLPFGVGGAVRLPRLRSALAERILAEAAAHRLLPLEPDARNRALLRLAHTDELRALWRRDPDAFRTLIELASGGQDVTLVDDCGDEDYAPRRVLGAVLKQLACPRRDEALRRERGERRGQAAS
jgi:hypothetical protein